jgi:hypothetical protein
MTSQHKIETENAGLHSAEDVARAIREATNGDLRRKIAELEGWTDVYPNGGEPCPHCGRTADAIRGVDSSWFTKATEQKGTQ